jgi:hypothetical protein
MRSRNNSTTAPMKATKIVPARPANGAPAPSALNSQPPTNAPTMPMMMSPTRPVAGAAHQHRGEHPGDEPDDQPGEERHADEPRARDAVGGGALPTATVEGNRRAESG